MDRDSGQVTNDAAEVYEAFFVPALFGAWPEVVLDVCDVREGHRVLDVACGTGVLARAAHLRAGSAGRVAGLDPNDGMLTVARRVEPTVDWRRGVAEAMPFPASSFDRVLCQFGIMFFTDREAALAEMARVVAPGGVVGVVTWASLDEIPGYAAMAELLQDLFDAETASALRAPFVMGDPVGLHDLVARVFPHVSVTRHAGEARFESIEAWVHTDIRGWTLSDAIDEGRYAALLSEARRRLDRFTDREGRVRFEAPALIAVASGR